MAQKGISWVLVGAFGYAWWWIGFQWSYLNVPEADMSEVFLLFALISLVLLHRGKSSAAGTSAVETSTEGGSDV